MDTIQTLVLVTGVCFVFRQVNIKCLAPTAQTPLFDSLTRHEEHLHRLASHGPHTVSIDLDELDDCLTSPMRCSTSPTSCILSDADYRIRLLSPNNEEDDSFLRGPSARCGVKSSQASTSAFKAIPPSPEIHRIRQEWVGQSHCTWEIGDRSGRDFFPTHRNHPGISEKCPVHALIAACNGFCLLLDDSWDQLQVEPPRNS